MEYTSAFPVWQVTRVFSVDDQSVGGSVVPDVSPVLLETCLEAAS